MKNSPKERPTDKDIRIAMAEIDGWEVAIDFWITNNAYSMWPHSLRYRGKPLKDSNLKMRFGAPLAAHIHLPSEFRSIEDVVKGPPHIGNAIPDYPNDLNSVREVEMLLYDGNDKPGIEVYHNTLEEICGNSRLAQVANARQKSEALIKTYNPDWWNAHLPGIPDSNGLIPAGRSCAYSDVCHVKNEPCPQGACPVADGRTISNAFSCGMARFFQIFGQPERKQKCH